MEYHLFRKTVKSGKKSIKKYYYWYYEPGSLKQIQKVCKKCSTKAEAENYIAHLPGVSASSTKICDIAREMFIPGSKHCLRREQMGKSIEPELLIDSRRYLSYIVADFGQKTLQS